MGSVSNIAMVLLANAGKRPCWPYASDFAQLAFRCQASYGTTGSLWLNPMTVLIELWFLTRAQLTGGRPEGWGAVQQPALDDGGKSLNGDSRDAFGDCSWGAGKGGAAGSGWVKLGRRGGV